MGLLYRAQQFFHTLFSHPTEVDLAEVEKTLSPNLFELFLRLQAYEQRHSIEIYKKLKKEGERNPDLLAAALLHDVGKSCYPIKLWERMLIVIGKYLFPQQVQKWGQASQLSWRRPFVVATQHASWGAELAAKAGASDLTINLIRKHQDNESSQNKTVGIPPEPITPEEMYLTLLQKLDDES